LTQRDAIIWRETTERRLVEARKQDHHETTSYNPRLSLRTRPSPSRFLRCSQAVFVAMPSSLASCFGVVLCLVRKISRTCWSLRLSLDFSEWFSSFSVELGLLGSRELEARTELPIERMRLCPSCKKTIGENERIEVDSGNALAI